jgi:hypothetical protein
VRTRTGRWRSRRGITAGKRGVPAAWIKSGAISVATDPPAPMLETVASSAASPATTRPAPTALTYRPTGGAKTTCQQGARHVSDADREDRDVGPVAVTYTSCTLSPVVKDRFPPGLPPSGRGLAPGREGPRWVILQGEEKFPIYRDFSG